MRRSGLACSILIVGILASSHAGAASSKEATALLAVDARFAAEVSSKGFAAFDSFFTDDAVYLPTFAPMLEGRQAILESFQPLIKDPNVRLNWTPLRAEVAKSGDLGWTTGSYEFSVTNAAGRTMTRRGKYVTIWRKETNGQWKAVLDGGSPDAPPDPPPAHP